MESTLQMLPIQKIRNDFPILNQKINGKPLVYFDNAATTQKPQVVIDSIVHYYQNYNANIHRGIHSLAEQATAAYESTRTYVAQFMGAAESEEIVFTRGVTEAINLVAQTYGRMVLQKGDEVIISTLEHHSNIVPWQMICAEKEAILKVIPINEAGEISIESFQNLLSNKTKIVSIVHASNALGTINPIQQIIALAHDAGAKVMIDGAQAASHLKIDVQNLDCDFYAFSGHKVYGPTGIGVLYGKKALLEAMPPYQGGGEMIKEVRFEGTTYNELPYKFEAGTPNIADTVALKTALEYIDLWGKDAIAEYEHELTQYASEGLTTLTGVKLVGTAAQKVSVCSFILEGVHPQDIGIILDSEGIAVRTGHHCTQPLMERLGIAGTARASFSFYNTKEEIDYMIKGMHKVIRMTK